MTSPVCTASATIRETVPLRLYVAVCLLVLPGLMEALASEFGELFGNSNICGSEVGVKIGAGGRYKLSDKLHLVGEAKYTVGRFIFLR